MTAAIRLWVEFVSLYVALPMALLAARRWGGPFPVLPVLWVAAYLAAHFLVTRQRWGVRELFGFSLNRRQLLWLGLRLALAGAALAGGILLVAPEQAFDLPRRDPQLWGLVMVFYPLVSVFPQGILYRGLFFARYACLFGTERQAWLAGCVVFSLAHLVFANVWAMALTLIGGLLLNRTYRNTGSLMVSNLEHAVYGQMVFTCGWGLFLYHGSVRLLEGFLR